MKLLAMVLMVLGLSGAVFAYEGCNDRQYFEVFAKKDANKPAWFAKQKEVAFQLAKLVSGGVVCGAAGHALGRIMLQLMAVPVSSQTLTLMQTLLLVDVGCVVGAGLGSVWDYFESLLQSRQYRAFSRWELELLGSQLVVYNSAVTTSFLLQSLGY